MTATNKSFQEAIDILELLSQFEEADLISLYQLQTIGDEVLPVLKRLLGTNYELLQRLLKTKSYSSSTYTTIELNLIQKMEQGNLIPTSQVESLARELFSVMDNKLTAGVMKTFQDLLDQVNSNKDNSLFIDIM